MFFHMVLRDSTPILQIHVDIKQCSPLLINVKLTAVIGFRSWLLRRNCHCHEDKQKSIEIAK